jgi:hypothetical protein
MLCCESAPVFRPGSGSRLAWRRFHRFSTTIVFKRSLLLKNYSRALIHQDIMGQDTWPAPR